MIGWKGKIFNFVSSLLPLKMVYSIKFYHLNGRKADLDNPSRFTDKLFWLIRYNGKYKKTLIQETYDKHTARMYVKEKGLSCILTEEYGNYKDASEINFDVLPDSFILKVTQSSGENIIVSDKKCVDFSEIRKKLNAWISYEKKSDRLFGYYFTKEQGIMCEELLHTRDGDIPSDYRICCCNGKAKWIYCDIDTTDENFKHKKIYYREYFDIDWNFLPVDNKNRFRKNKDFPTLKKPENLEKMIYFAEILAKDFIFVRVDLYNIEGKIYFGELTPIPGMAGGFNPDEWDFKFGNMISLPDVKLW